MSRSSVVSATTIHEVDHCTSSVHAKTHERVQLYDRTLMNLLWTNRKKLFDERDKSQLSLLKTLYDGRMKGQQLGKRVITYKLSSSSPGKLGYGRYYGGDGSLETLEQDIRATLCSELYTDLDMVNCHPTLIVQYAKRYFDLDMPYLKGYVDNRQGFFKKMYDEFDLEEAVVKNAIIIILYNGAVKVNHRDSVDFVHQNTLPRDMVEMKKEMKQLCKMIIKKNEHNELYKYYLRQDNNVQGSFMALLIQTEERYCLDAMVEFLEELEFQIDVLAYDGCMIRGKNAIDEAAIAKTEKQIEATTGYKLKLKVKPMIPISFEEDTKNEKIIPSDVIVDDKYACEVFVQVMGDSIVKQDGIIYAYNDKIGMWDTGKSAIISAIYNVADMLIFKQKTEDNKIRVFNYGGVSRNINNMLSFLDALVPSSNFIKQNIKKSLKYLLFEDGIYDIKNRAFTVGFDKTKVFLGRIEKKFTDRDAVNDDIYHELNQALFENPFQNKKVGDYYKNRLARGIAGDIEDKKFYFLLGDTNCGKGTITTGMSNTFDNYVDEWNINNLKYNPRNSDDEAKKMAWVKPFIYKRCAFSNEGRMDRTSLDGNLIKTLSGGGDSIKSRCNFKDETKEKFLCTMFSFGNDISPIAPLDGGLKDRLRYIRFDKHFVNKPMEECAENEMPADPAIKNKLETAEYQAALFWIIMDAYGPMLAEPAEVIEETNEYVPLEEDIIKTHLEDKYEITHKSEDSVSARELINYLQEKRLNISDHKIGRELKKLGLLCICKTINTKSVKIYTGIKETPI